MDDWTKCKYEITLCTQLYVGRPACTAGIAVSLYRFPGVILCRPSSPLVLDRCDLGLEATKVWEVGQG